MFFVFPFNQLMWSTTKRPNVRLFAFLCLCGPFTLFLHLSHPCLCMIHFSLSFKSSFHWPACWQLRQPCPCLQLAHACSDCLRTNRPHLTTLKRALFTETEVWSISHLLEVVLQPGHPPSTPTGIMSPASCSRTCPLWS